MEIQFMKDYYDLRYEETDGENHFVDETAYQEKQSEQSKMEDQLMEMVGGSESNVWKLYESIMCIYFDMEDSTWKKSSSRPFICRELMIGNGC